MKNTLKQFGFAVLMTVIALSTLPLTGCQDNDPAVDSALNGTWLYQGGVEVKFDNGNFETVGFFKGTYTTSGDNLTLIITHIHGNYYSSSGFESKWYTKPEFKAKAKTINPSITDAQVDLTINNFFLGTIGIPVNGSTANVFTTMAGKYSVNNNTLTITMDEGTMILTKS